jgi:hypothetical protein
VNIKLFVHADASPTMASTPQKIGALVSDIDNNAIYISALVVKNINFSHKQMYDRLNVLMQIILGYSVKVFLFASAKSEKLTCDIKQF